MNNIQIIERDGKPEWAVMPFDEYQRLMALAEDRQDAADAAAALVSVQQGNEELLPQEVVKRLISGESPVRVWREHRGLTQKELAQASGLTQAMITMIENGHRKGTVQTLTSLAKVLKIDLDDLLK